MIKTMTVGVAVVAALAAGAPAAYASHYRYDCRLVAYRQADVTGASYQGVLAGYVFGYTSDSLTVSCIVTVNGVVSSSTPPGSSVAGAAVTAYDVSFNATPDDDVDVCISITGSHNHYECYNTTHQQLPPDVVTDSVDAAYAQAWANVDATLCPITASLSPGVNPWLEIGPHGDVFVNGTLYYDCPPYGTGHPAPSWPSPVLLLTR